MLTVLTFFASIVADIFLFVFGFRLVKSVFRLTKTGIEKATESLDQKIKNYEPKRKEAKPEYNRYIKVDGTVK